MQTKQEAVIPEVFCRESQLKDNGSSTKDFEDDVLKELLNLMHKHVNYWHQSLGLTALPRCLISKYTPALL